jgi:cellulose synthase/poly-beta-1,6-N-acetylglucosamine synthase-like glycosyltransferase
MAIFLFIFLVLMIIYAFLIEYYRRSWNEMPEFNPISLNEEPFISVVVPARNEERNLRNLIDSLKQQTYPSTRFEVIIVDDHSTDESWKMFESASEEAITIRVVKLADYLSSSQEIKAHKKFAIEKGVDLAKGELIVTTDADCVSGKNWLTYIASLYISSRAKFIAAPVKIKTNTSFLSIFQSLDFLTLQGITGASVYKRFHTMCNGANLAYERAAFYEVGGFTGVDNIASGDDMLLMYKIYKRYPEHVFYLKNKEAIVTTEPVTSWRQFFNQRIRWASKATHYDDKKIVWILLLVYCINLFFLILAIASFWKATWFFLLLLLLAAKILVEFPFVNGVAIFFSERRLMKYFPFMQPVHILYTIIAGWLGKFGSYEWKGRRIKQ